MSRRFLLLAAIFAAGGCGRSEAEFAAKPALTGQLPDAPDRQIEAMRRAIEAGGR
jgi:hypothetical protein